MVLQWKGRKAPADAPPAQAGPLDNLPLNGKARVSRVEGPEPLRRHLLELGFTEGSEVTYRMATPFGDPKVYHLRGAAIALRRSEARCIQVAP